MDHSISLQRALYARLTSDAGLMADITGVYDVAPAAAVSPYIIIGFDSVAAFDSKSTSGQAFLVQFSVYSDAFGLTQAKTITAHLYRLLHQQNFTIAGAHLVYCRFEGAEHRFLRSGVLQVNARYRVSLQSA